MSDVERRLVRQEHDWGCGVAALAMVTGQTYDEVWSWMLGNWVHAVFAGEPAADWLEHHGVTQYALDWYLGQHGFVWRRVYRAWVSGAWPPEPFAPVHVAQVVQPSGNAHFVVLTADGRVLDPMSDAPRSLSDWEQVNHVLGVWSLAEVRAEALAEGERKARRNRHCGCAWCCSTVPPEKRGKAHQETCQPKPSAAALASGRAAVGEDSEGAGL